MKHVRALSITVFLTMALFMVGQPVLAAPSGGHLNITEVLVNDAADTIIITGEDLDFGPGPLEVRLGTVPGDITLDCLIPPPTAITIVCDLSSSGGLPPAGDYLLSVSMGNGQSQAIGQSQDDEYDLTIPTISAMTMLGFYQTSRENVIIQIGQQASISATCDLGDKLTGGGFATFAGVDVNRSKPQSDRSWLVRVVNNSGAVSTFSVFAICADLTP